MRRSNPVVSAVVDGVALDLVLTADVSGVWVCLDLHSAGSAATVTKGVDFDYARKLLRRQLSTLETHRTPRTVHLPAWNRSQAVSVAYFGLAEQLVRASAVEFFLLGVNASGFLGVGLPAARTDEALGVWALLGGDSYAYKGMAGGGNHSADVALESAWATPERRQWSEPAGPSMADATSADAKRQDTISFPIHSLHFRCRKPVSPSIRSDQEEESDEEKERDEDDEASAASGALVRTVDVFGGVSGNWDAVVDLNAPCLVLPTEFYSALAGWIGLTYNERLRVSELPPSSTSPASPLPVLYFSLAYGARPVALPLEALALPELQLQDASAPTQAARRLCVQRSDSIVQNGATVFAHLDSDAATVQRYRIQGSLSLPLFNMVQAPVVLGAMAVEALGGLAVNGANRSCGVTVRSAAELAADDLLAAMCTVEPAVCVGEQQYAESTNTCQDPDCALYYFHSLDMDAKRCVIDPAWLTTLAVTSTAFAAAELFLSTSIRRLVLGAALEATAS